MENIKYIAIGRISDWELFLNYLPQKKNKNFEEMYHNETVKFMKTPISSIKNQRNEMTSPYGELYAIYDDNYICYIVLCAPDYGGRNAYAFLQEVREVIEEKYPEIVRDPERKDLSLAGAKIYIMDICKRANTDRMHDAEVEVNEVILGVHNTVNQMVKDADQMRDVEAKGENMLEGAKAFDKHTEDMSKIFWWRNCKIRVIFIAMAVAIVLYLVVPIIQDKA